MPARPQIRAALASDVPGIFAVRTSVTENLLTAQQLADIGITPASIAQMIAATPCAWVAVQDGIVIGFAMIDWEEGALFAAFVLPRYEGFGIGKMLVRMAEDALFQHHTMIWLETGATTRAAGFYRHLGWQVLGEMGGDLRMEKRR